jgi:Ca-activated chloride channel family protein
MNNFVWASPWFFLLFALLPLLIWWYWKQMEPNQPTLHISSNQTLEGIVPSLRIKFRHLPFVMRILALSAFIIALARPQSSTSWQNTSTEGIDIILSMDMSPSMLAEDFKPNRLESSKKEAVEFIDKRPDDRIGMVVFSGEAFTQVPLTSDHAVTKNLMEDLKSGMLEDGTAIGNGLALAVKRLLGSKAKSRVIILLTDGINNAGEIAPLTAAEIAKTFGIRVYTIGVGTHGMAPYPMQTPWGTIQYQQMEVKIDEPLMKKIASMTKGQYFRATNNKNLRDVYNEIDKLEKSKIETTEFRKRKEEFLLFALIGLGFLLTELLLKNTWLRSLP